MFGYWKDPFKMMMLGYKWKDTFGILIKLTRGVCRGLPCYAASPEKLFSFLEKTTIGLSGRCSITRWSSKKSLQLLV